MQPGLYNLQDWRLSPFEIGHVSTVTYALHIRYESDVFRIVVYTFYIRYRRAGSLDLARSRVFWITLETPNVFVPRASSVPRDPTSLHSISAVKLRTTVGGGGEVSGTDGGGVSSGVNEEPGADGAEPGASEGAGLRQGVFAGVLTANRLPRFFRFSTASKWTCVVWCAEDVMYLLFPRTPHVSHITSSRETNLLVDMLTSAAMRRKKLWDRGLRRRCCVGCAALHLVANRYRVCNVYVTDVASPVATSVTSVT